MPKRQQAREPEVRPIRISRHERPLRRGQAGDLAVRRRQHDDIALCLAEIDGLAAVIDLARLGGEEMHRISRPALP